MDPGMTEISGIHHVMVAIPKGGEEAARAFYAGALGLSELPKPEALAGRGGLWVSAGNIELHLGIDPEFRPATKAHVAFQVAGIAELRQRLITSGYRVVPDDSLPGYERYYVDDPFGNRLEILQPREH
jgi:catechol 2,3-dioxygenase-like lactoylglutathione lyase family enzyme